MKMNVEVKSDDEFKLKMVFYEWNILKRQVVVGLLFSEAGN